jgi:antitoxin FitA
MAKIIQIRNVPDELHPTLKARAAGANMSLSDYLLSKIEQIAEKPPLSEIMERLRRLEPVKSDEEHRPEAIIRRARDAENPRDLG